MKLLITGGFGYLGGRIVQYLAQNSENEIRLGSRRFSEPPQWLTQVKIVQTQWNSSDCLEELCEGVDAVIHLAGMNAQDCESDPVAALEVNAVSTTRLLQAAIRKRVKRIIYLSTAHVYCSPLMGVITEETCPTSLHPYATSHRAGEDVVRFANMRGDIDGVVVRLSNAIGAPAHKDANCWMLLVNDLCRQAVVDRCLVMNSSGQQLRDFITLHDVQLTIHHLLNMPKDHIGNGLFNVGGGEALRVINLVELIQSRCSEVLGFVPEIIRPESSSDESDHKLDYRIDKLLSTGFSLDGNYEDEIDATLLLCQDEFGTIQ